MRIRWLGFQTNLDASAITSHLQNYPYEDDAQNGFRVEQMRSSFVEACLIQRLQTTHEITDPYGRREYYDIVEYLRTHFRINPNSASLELRDAGRTASRLLSRLMEALDQQFLVEEISVDPLTWANAFREIIGVYGSIDRVQIGSIAVGESAVGQVLVKGNDDVSEAAISFIAPAKYTLEKVQLKLRSKRGSISFQRNASVVVSSRFDEKLMDALRESLALISEIRR